MKTSPRRTLGAGWWLKRASYFLVFLRELTAVFIAAYLVLLLVLLHKVQGDAGAYAAYLEFLRSPGMIAFHLIALAFALMHSITWFNLLPKGIAVRLGEQRVPAVMVAGPNYVALLVVTAIVLWVVLA